MKISGVDRCSWLIQSSAPLERCPLIVPFNPRRFEPSFEPRTTSTCTNPFVRRERGSGATADFPPLLPPSPVLHRFHDVALTLFPYRESLLEGKDSPPWGIVIDPSPPKRFHSFSTPLLFLLIQHWNISIGRSRLLRILALTRILVKGVPSIAFQLHEGIA